LAVRQTLARQVCRRPAPWGAMISSTTVADRASRTPRKNCSLVALCPRLSIALAKKKKKPARPLVCPTARSDQSSGSERDVSRSVSPRGRESTFGDRWQSECFKKSIQALDGFLKALGLPAPGNRHPHPLITTPTSSLEIELHTTHRPSWHRDDHSSSPVHEVCSLTAVASTRREPAFCLSMDELTRHFPPRSCVGRPAASPTGQNDWCTSNVRRLCSQFSLASTASSRSLQHVVPAGPAGPRGPRGRVPCVQGQPEDH